MLQCRLEILKTKTRPIELRFKARRRSIHPSMSFVGAFFLSFSILCVPVMYPSCTCDSLENDLLFLSQLLSQGNKIRVFQSVMNFLFMPGVTKSSYFCMHPVVYLMINGIINRVVLIGGLILASLM